jgi:hypothetical protein
LDLVMMTLLLTERRAIDLMRVASELCRDQA